MSWTDGSFPLVHWSILIFTISIDDSLSWQLQSFSHQMAFSLVKCLLHSISFLTSSTIKEKKDVILRNRKPCRTCILIRKFRVCNYSSFARLRALTCYSRQKCSSREKMSELSSSPAASVQRLSNKQSTVLRKFIIDRQDKISDEWNVQVDHECFYGLSQSYAGN